MFYCKFCASKLDTAGVTQCPVCASRIDLLDGGQTYFEEADLYLWSLKDEDLQQDMPKTELRHMTTDGKLKSVKAQSRQNYSKSAGKQEKAYKSVSHMAVIKTGLICIAAVLTVMLVSILAIKLIDRNGDNKAVELPQVSSNFKTVSQLKAGGENEEAMQNVIPDANKDDEQKTADKADDTTVTDVVKQSQIGYPDKDLLPDELTFTLKTGDNLGRLYKKGNEGTTLSGLVKESELGFLSFGKAKSFFVSVNDFEDLMYDLSGEKCQKIENTQTGEYVFKNYGKSQDLVVTLNKDGDKYVADTSNSKVEVEENKHFAVNARGLHFFEIDFLCDYFGFSWDVKETKSEGKDTEAVFEIKLKKNK